MSNTSGDQSVAALTESRDRARFHLYLVAAAIWTAIFIVLPADLKPAWYVIFGWGSVISAALRTRSLPREVRRVARIIILAGALSLTGGIVRAIEAAATGLTYPFPSLADVFPLLSYAFFLGGIITIVRHRVRRLTLDPIIDAVLGGTAVAALQWSIILIPYLRDGSVAVEDKAMNVVFAGSSLLLIVAAVLALVSGAKRSVSNQILAAGLVSTFVLDAITTLVTAGHLHESIRLYFAPVVMFLGAAGLLHPSVKYLTSRPTDENLLHRLTTRRTAVLSLALIVPPTLMAIGLLQGNLSKLYLPTASALLLAPLVVTRLGRLVRHNEKLAGQEATLRGIGEHLVGADSEDDVAMIVTEGAKKLLKANLLSGRLVTYPNPEARRQITDPDLDMAIAELTAIVSAEEFAPDDTLITIPGPDGTHWSAGLVTVQGTVRAALVVSTHKDLSEVEMNAVSALCRESAIAFLAVEQTELQVRLRSEARFGALIDNSSDIVAVLNIDGYLTYCSPVAERLLGYPSSILDRGYALSIIHPDDLASAEGVFQSIKDGAGRRAEVRLRHFAGTYSWFEVVGVDMSEDPNVNGVVINAREITDRKEAEEQLRVSEARFKALVQNSTDLVVVMDREGFIRYSSPSIGEVTGIDYAAVLNAPFNDVFADNTLDWDSASIHSESDHIANLVEFTFVSTNDEVHTMETTVLDLCSEPAINGYVLNARDVTYRKKMEQQLRYQATHDELTGLANRVHAADDLTGMLARNSGSTTVAAILIDIDEFKDINDSLGHDVGDELLISVAERIKQTLSFGDVAARTGGDEFAIIVERSHGESQIMELAESLMTALSGAFTIDGREISITTSTGVAFDHDRTNSGELMLRNADTAMYRAKHLGKRQITVFEPYMHTASFDRLELRADLARAVAHDQFVAFYQPVINIDTRRIVGAEALIRWEHPQRGLLGPGLFIPLAEETGLIAPMGEWMLERACTDLAMWRNDYGSLVDRFTMSVNLSAQQLHHDDIIGRITEILRRSGLPAERLVLEVTESMLITETDKAGETMRQIRDLGARLSIDDFGTGYSSLGYMQQFEFDVLKIDKSFIDDIDQVTNQRIVSAVLSLAANLGVKTIAEGIEEESQAEQVRALGCHLAQGYLYSRPVPEAEFRKLLDRERSLAAAEGK